MGATLLSLEQFAEISARIDAGLRAEQVLTAAGVPVERWEASRAFWLDRIAHLSANRRFELGDRYAALFAEFRAAALRAKGPERAPLQGAAPVAVRVANNARAAENVIFLRPGSAEAAQGSSKERARDAAPPPPAGAPAAKADSKSPPAASPKGQATLSVHQFAFLRAELALAPDSGHAAILARHQLDSSAWATEEAIWQERLASDQALLASYLTQFRYLRGLLGSGRRK